LKQVAEGRKELFTEEGREEKAVDWREVGGGVADVEEAAEFGERRRVRDEGGERESREGERGEDVENTGEIVYLLFSPISSSPFCQNFWHNLER
jgi:hypothetical protein